VVHKDHNHANNLRKLQTYNVFDKVDVKVIQTSNG